MKARITNGWSDDLPVTQMGPGPDKTVVTVKEIIIINIKPNDLRKTKMFCVQKPKTFCENSPFLLWYVSTMFTKS